MSENARRVVPESASEGEPVTGVSGRARQVFPWGAMGILFLAHFIVDSHLSFLAPLLPLLREKLQISLTSAGVLVYLLSISMALGQPLTAVVVDRWPRIPWLPMALIGSSFALTAMGWLPSFAAVAIALPLGGALVGLCHPDMASRAGALTDSRKGLSIGFLLAGGRLGSSLGPLIAIGWAEWWGMEWLWTYALLGAGMAVAVQWGLPNLADSVVPSRGDYRGLWVSMRNVRGPLLVLMMISILRFVVSLNLMGFLPTLYVERGMSLWGGGVASAIALFSGAIGVMVGGGLSDRFGKRIVLAYSHGLAFLSVIAFLWVPPGWGYLVLIAVGAGLSVPMVVGVALSQDFLPGQRAFASSLVLGLAMFLGSLSVLPLSAVAEQVGLGRAFWTLPICLLVALLMTWLLPDDRPRARPAS